MSDLEPDNVTADHGHREAAPALAQAAAPRQALWRGILKHLRWKQTEWRGKIERLAQEPCRGNDGTFGDQEGFVDIVQNVDDLMARSEEDDKYQLRLYELKLKNVPHDLRVDKYTQEGLVRTSIMDCLDPAMERDSAKCDIHVEVDVPGERRRRFHYYLPQNTRESRIQEKVARELGKETSQLQILDSRLAMPTGDGTLNKYLLMQLEDADYVLQMRNWPPHDSRQQLTDFIHSLEDRPSPTAPGKTWSSTGELSNIVRVITQLLERDLAVTRGPKKDDNFVGETYKEILNVLEDCLAKNPHATPGELLQEL